MDTRRDQFKIAKWKMGAALLDVPRLGWALHGPKGWGAHWTRFGNRADRLTPDPDGGGMRCDWEYSRPLFLCHVFHPTGQVLLKHALRDWPVRLQSRPDQCRPDGVFWNGEASTGAEGPEVSVIIGHRGTVRLPHLRHTLESIAAQEGVRLECIVVEQDAAPLVRDTLPDWVRYLHDPMPGPDAFFNRSRALNAGARIARAPALILHDNDMLLAARHVAEHLKVQQQGHEVVDLKRFAFYMAEQDWDRPLLLPELVRGRVEHVIENLRAGGSLFIARNAFEAIGGMDESFVSWGGEDVEFWERAMTRRVWNFGTLPIVHLGHPDQPGKTSAMDAAWRTRTRQSLDVPPKERIAALVAQTRTGRE